MSQNTQALSALALSLLAALAQAAPLDGMPQQSVAPGTLTLATPASTPLRLDEAVALAVRDSASLAGQDASVEAARKREVSAGSLPDPKLFLGLDNLPINGAEAWNTQVDPMTMETVGVMQDMPNRDRRDAETGVAVAQTAVEMARRRVLRVQVRREAAQAWIGCYWLGRKLVLLDALDQENRALQQMLQAQVAAGSARATQLVLAQQEAAELADRRDVLQQESSQARIVLRKLIGARADAPLADDPPSLVPDARVLRASLRDQADLAVYAPLEQKAQAEERVAEAAKQSDWGVSLAWQKRNPAYGDMMSLQFTYTLPVFSATRKDPDIAASQQDRLAVVDQREQALRDRRATLESELEQYQTLQRQIDRIRQVWLPLVQQKQQLQLAAYRANRGSADAVIEARRDATEQQFRLLDLLARRDALGAQLHYVYAQGASS